jgi:integrase
VGWYEGGRRKAKALPSKALAEHFRNMKYAQLNSDVFTGVVDFSWDQILEEYRRAKQVEGLQEASIYETRLTLRHFERLVGACSSRQITQQVLDKFVLERGKEVGKNTLNKDIRNIGAFLNWAVKNRYTAADLAVKRVKVQQKPVQALSPQQVKDLIAAARDYPTLRIRILLAVTTGLRRGDIQAIRIGDIHFDRNTITTQNRKAGKAMAERPIPEEVMTELSNHVTTLPDGQEKLFADRYSAQSSGRRPGRLQASPRSSSTTCERRSRPCWPKEVCRPRSRNDCWNTRPLSSP